MFRNRRQNQPSQIDRGEWEMVTDAREKVSFAVWKLDRDDAAVPKATGS